ncbi:MAG: hypothetical protein K2Y22_02500 [Candidatus Obscuribacterales bacterium]|nr:hypothetical protein [Candidatus Obscuribacterales bacterium]
MIGVHIDDRSIKDPLTKTGKNVCAIILSEAQDGGARLANWLTNQDNSKIDRLILASAVNEPWHSSIPQSTLKAQKQVYEHHIAFGKKHIELEKLKAELTCRFPEIPIEVFLQSGSIQNLASEIGKKYKSLQILVDSDTSLLATIANKTKATSVVLL